MNIRRWRFQRQIVLFMAMRTSHCVKVLPFRLLRRKLLPGMASVQSRDKAENNRQ